MKTGPLTKHKMDMVTLRKFDIHIMAPTYVAIFVFLDLTLFEVYKNMTQFTVIASLKVETELKKMLIHKKFENTYFFNKKLVFLQTNIMI